MKALAKRINLDILFFVLLLIKVFGAGFTYFQTLDDYIQYGGYPLYNNLSYVLFYGIGTAANYRPLATMLDPTLWGSFYGNMAVALLLICVLHFFSAKLFHRVLSACGITIKPLFYGVYLLLPLGFEGTYWISASSRLVVGLFFTALALYALNNLLKNKKPQMLLLYGFASLCSFGFYESVMVLSGLAQGMLILRHLWLKKNLKTLGLLLVPALSLAALLFYYSCVKNMGVMGNRASEFSFDHFGLRIQEFFSQFTYIFTAGLFRTTINGFGNGIKILLQSGFLGVVTCFIIVLLALLCARNVENYTFSAKARFCVPLGILFTLVPLLPNLLVENVWLTYRSIVVCLPGLCFTFAPLAQVLLKKKRVKQIAIFCMVTLFSVGCVNELYTYKAVYETDSALVAEVASRLDDEVLAGEKNTVLVLPHEIIVPQTSYYKDHVKSVFYSDWSITGAVRAKLKNVKIKTITPVYSLEGVDTEGKQILYMDENYRVTEDVK